MTKYLFYAAFFYFCWYAGNKAFPPTGQQTQAAYRTEQTSTSSNEKYFMSAKNVNALEDTHLNSGPDKNYVQEKGWQAKKQLLPHINTNITSKYNLIISPVSSRIGQLNFNQRSLTSYEDMQPLTVLNKTDK